VVVVSRCARSLRDLTNVLDRFALKEQLWKVRAALPEASAALDSAARTFQNVKAAAGATRAGARGGAIVGSFVAGAAAGWLIGKVEVGPDTTVNDKVHDAFVPFWDWCYGNP
jgi:hypothetical protein